MTTQETREGRLLNLATEATANANVAYAYSEREIKPIRDFQDACSPTAIAAAMKVVRAARDKLALLKYPDGTGGHDEDVCAAVYHPNGLCTCGTDQLTDALACFDKEEFSDRG